jgi:ribosomal silencing factor RsfS
MRSRSTSDPESTRQFAIDMARTLADSKCTDVVLLDVRGRSQVSDYVIIGSGTSQMR